MRLLSMKKNLKDPMNENEDAVQKYVWNSLLQKCKRRFNLQFVINWQ